MNIFTTYDKAAVATKYDHLRILEFIAVNYFSQVYKTIHTEIFSTHLIKHQKNLSINAICIIYKKLYDTKYQQ